MTGQAYLIRCGTLIDGTGAPPQHQMAVLVEGNTITSILPLAQAPAGERLTVVDAGGQTVMPGLMDLHLHLGMVVDPQEPNLRLSLHTASMPMLTLHAAKHARLMLEGGFTTIRDLASPADSANVVGVALRRGIELGLIPGPRLIVAGWVMQTAAHLDMSTPFTWHRDPDETADGPWEVRKRARTLLRIGVDQFKTSASGSIGGYIEDFTWRNYTVEELSALADEAHAVGKLLAVHADTARAIKNAVAAGADTIEHGFFVDDEAAELMAKHGKYLIPTLSLSSQRAYEGRLRGGVSTAEVLRKHRMIIENHPESFQRALRAGVRMAMGTDTARALREYFGKNAYELELMVQYGMSPMEAIVASTGGAAQAIGTADRFGTLRPGLLADLIVVDGDPLADIRVLQEADRIKVVMKEGTIAVDRRAGTVASLQVVP